MVETNVRGADPRNYLVAQRASLWFRPVGSNDPADWIDLGSVREVEKAPDNQRLEHFSNRRGERAKDKEIISQRSLTINFLLEEFNIHNLQLAFGDKEDPTVGVVDVKENKIAVHPGTFEAIALGMTAIKNVIVRGMSLETQVTYVEEEVDVDTTDNTQGGDFNNITSPLTVVAAVTNYPGATFAVDKLYKIGSEILRVSAVVGNDVTFLRGQFGTTNAVHADALDLFEEAGNDYYVDYALGNVYALESGALADPLTVTEMHIFWERETAATKFRIFPGDTVEGQLQFQLLGEGGAKQVYEYPSCSLSNNGAIPFGDGWDFDSIPMSAAILVDSAGEIGTGSLVDEGEIS